jgi:uncharacterized protein Smg (DUF494 family)
LLDLSRDKYGIRLRIHEKLDSYRSNQNREFFQLPIEKAKSIVCEIAELLIRHILAVEAWELKIEDGRRKRLLN